MGKRKRPFPSQNPGRSQPRPPSTEVSSDEPPAPAEGVPSLTGWRKWMFRSAVMILVPGFIVLLLEITLRLFGYGYSTSFFLKMKDGTTYTANRYFGWQFFSRETSTYPHPLLMPAEKQAGTLRIFILGESAALGTPAPAFGFGRILEVMLRQQYPEQRFEVINAAMRGVDSNIILPIARECAQHQPDLFLVYMGNNEAIGRYAPEPDSRNLRSNLRLLRAEQRIKRTRSCQWLESINRKLFARPEKKAQDMEFFRKHRLASDDPHRESIYKNFQANLRDICRAARESQAKVIVSTVAVNLKDFPPFGSLHRADLADVQKAGWESAYAQGASAEAAGKFEAAIPSFLEAARIDDHFAELHFRLGRCYLASGQIDKAQERYQRARDWDALQFRTDNRLNQLIRDATSSRSADGVVLVDMEQALENTSEHRIPGYGFFSDHVHFSFDGDYLMAKTLLPAVAAILGLTNAIGPIPSRVRCAEWLAFTHWEEVHVAASVVKTTAQPPFLDQLEHKERQARAEQTIQEAMRQFTPERLQQIAKGYRAAITRVPNDWQLHHAFANFLLFARQDYRAAADELKVVVSLLPETAPMRQSLGHALLRAGQPQEALNQFYKILEFDRNYTPAAEAIAKLNAQRP